MGFFSKLKSASTWKKGKKHADNGNFEKALVYFDDATRATTDERSVYEYRAWYYLSKALNCSKLNQINEAKEAFENFTEEVNSFKAACTNNPGLGSTMMFNTSYEAMLALCDKNDSHIQKIENY